MPSVRVLITNLVLLGRSGSEMYVQDLALGLSKRGHTPIVYSPRLGTLAQELRVAGIAVTDNLHAVSPEPDLIHGHHNLPTMAAGSVNPSSPGSDAKRMRRVATLAGAHSALCGSG